MPNPRLSITFWRTGARHNIIFSAVAMGETEIGGGGGPPARIAIARRSGAAHGSHKPTSHAPHTLAVRQKAAGIAYDPALDHRRQYGIPRRGGFHALSTRPPLRGETTRWPKCFSLAAPKSSAARRLRLAVNSRCRQTAPPGPGMPEAGQPLGLPHRPRRAHSRPVSGVIEALIRAGASRQYPATARARKTAVDSTHGYTPLHAAAFHGNPERRFGSSETRRRCSHQRGEIPRHSQLQAGASVCGPQGSPGDLILQGPVDIMEAVEYGLTDRILAILAQDAEALNRPFSAYPLYPLYAEGSHTPLAFAVIRGNRGNGTFVTSAMAPPDAVG